jgi:hypothetical protein
MIHTPYSDAEEIRRYVEAHPELAQKGEALMDVWLSVAENEAEYHKLCQLIPETRWLVAARLWDGTYAVLHRKVDELQETKERFFPSATHSDRWKRSKAFWTQAGEHGWGNAGFAEYQWGAAPIRKFLRARFGKICPWHLTDEEFRIAWRVISRPPTDKAKVN